MTAINLGKEASTDSNGVVRVTVMAGDTQEVQHASGLKTKDYLDKAGVTVPGGAVVTVNGAPADMDEELAAGSVVVVADKVVNG